MPARRRNRTKAPAVAAADAALERAVGVRTTGRRAPRRRGTRGRAGSNGNVNGRQAAMNFYQRAVKLVDNVNLDELMDNVRGRFGTLFRSGEVEMQKMSRQFTLMLQMIKSRWDIQRDLPWRTVAAMTVVVMYFIGPFDLIPDFIPFVGFLDDAAVLGICFKLIQHDLKEYAQAEGIELAAYGLK